MVKLVVACLFVLSFGPFVGAYQSFEEFVEKHDKVYATKDEKDRRRAIYETNLEQIVMHNNQLGNSNYQLGLNHFMDLEGHEIPLGYDKSLRYGTPEAAADTGRQLFMRHRYHHHKNKNKHDRHHLHGGKNNDDRSGLDFYNYDEDLPFSIDDVSTLPDSVDWRFAATPVKDQGGCGSCWAFASIAAAESHLFLSQNQLWTLSVQELVSCCPNPKQCGGKGGCTGATSVQAYDYLSQAGMVSEWSFGYQSYYGNNHVNCSLEPKSWHTTVAKGAVATMESFTILPPNNYTVMMNAIAKVGPVVISVAAEGWQFYKSGVFRHKFKSPRDSDLDHAVVLYGYGTDQETGEDYWLVRNSWSPRWGEDGYIRLFRQDPSAAKDEDECAMDVTPGDGDACKYDDDGKRIDPLPAEKICGTSGVYTAGYIPLGLKLV